MGKDDLRIGEAAETLGVRVETLRRWEREGKLTTTRSAGGQRLVPAAEVARLLAARRAAKPEPTHTSRRNAFPGVVTKVTKDKVSALVEIQAGPHRVVSLITREAADELRLRPGMPATATVKATSVMVEVPGPMKELVVLTIALSLAAIGCSTDPTTSSGPAAVEPVELTVFAASSLTDAFTGIGEAFSAEHAGVTVTFNFGSSTDLAGQIASEGTADVFASASGTTMDLAADDPGVTDEVAFATNSLAVVAPPDNPAGVASIEDLANDGVQLVLGAEGVPVGDYAREALDNAGILEAAEANVVSNEEDNASVVAKIVADEADAAIVYASDVSAAAANELTSFVILDEVNVIATYPIAAVTGSPNGSTAQAFIDYVMGPGQATLAEYGFGPAPG